MSWKGQHLDYSFTSNGEIMFNISKSSVFMHMTVLQALITASGDVVQSQGHLTSDPVHTQVDT